MRGLPASWARIRLGDADSRLFCPLPCCLAFSSSLYFVGLKLLELRIPGTSPLNDSCLLSGVALLEVVVLDVMIDSLSSGVDACLVLLGVSKCSLPLTAEADEDRPLAASMVDNVDSVPSRSFSSSRFRCVKSATCSCSDATLHFSLLLGVLLCPPAPPCTPPSALSSFSRNFWLSSCRPESLHFSWSIFLLSSSSRTLSLWARTFLSMGVSSWSSMIFFFSFSTSSLCLNLRSSTFIFREVISLSYLVARVALSISSCSISSISARRVNDTLSIPVWSWSISTRMWPATSSCAAKVCSS
mmetsp:Transcript_29377/g.60055  ORF Transcript_29377/g.60055 Transcript_29377/m.60055 type:complete len:300 (-) Transcript_29377:831-1730(-)